MYEEQLKQEAQQAAKAVTMLKAMQKNFMAKVITYDEMKELGAPLIKVFNTYAKSLSKARKMPYKPITLGYFMR